MFVKCVLMQKDCCDVDLRKFESPTNLGERKLFVEKEKSWSREELDLVDE